MEMFIAVLVGCAIGGVFIDIADTIEKYSDVRARIKQKKSNKVTDTK